MKSGQIVYLCFSTDFLIEEADEWRNECWKMMRERSDLDVPLKIKTELITDFPFSKTCQSSTKTSFVSL